MKQKLFLTLNELSRSAGVPASRVNAAVEAGLISPAGRAGSNKNSPLIFSSEDLPRLKDALLSGITMKGCSTSTGFKCESAADVRAKHAAMIRATEEAAK